jgi:hypothetical protein
MTLDERGGPLVGSATWEYRPMNVEHLQILEAAQSELQGDIGAIRQAILKGSQLSPRDRERLIEHLRKTLILLAAAKQVCEEMLSSLANSPE